VSFLDLELASGATPGPTHRYGDFEIFVMNADGSNVVSLGQQGVSTSWGG